MLFVAVVVVITRAVGLCSPGGAASGTAEAGELKPVPAVIGNRTEEGPCCFSARGRSNRSPPDKAWAQVQTLIRKLLDRWSVVPGFQSIFQCCLVLSSRLVPRRSWEHCAHSVHRPLWRLTFFVRKNRPGSGFYHAEQDSQIVSVVCT